MYRNEKITKEELRYKRLKQTFDDLQFEVSDVIINQIAEDYIRYLSGFEHLFPNTKEGLEYLYPNYTLHIITNGFHEIQGKKLRNSGIAHYFSVVMDSEVAGVKTQP